MNAREWDRAWAEKERLDSERRGYEENCAWAAFRLWFGRLLILILIIAAVMVVAL